MVFFWVCFFSGFKVIVFLCLVELQKCLKMLVFPVLGCFVGWVILVYLGLEGLGVWCSCVSFFFLVCFVFVLLLDCFWCWLLFCFCFLIVCFLSFFCFFCFCFFFGFSFCLFLFFVFFGGFKGQVRWPKGPPHLALNPPYVISFVFLFCFFCLFFFVFVFCFFGRV